MKFKILLIHANSTLDTLIPPNLAVINSVLKHAGYETKLFDTTFYKTRKITGDDARVKTLQVKKTNFENLGIYIKTTNMYDDFIKMVEDYQPNLIGMSAVSATYPFGVKLLRQLRQDGFTIPTIVGGTHATISAKDILNESCIDYVCVGEGEDAFVELCDALKNGKDTSNIKNIWIKKGNKIIENMVRPPVDINKIPFQDWSIFDDKRIHKAMEGKIKRTGCFELSRGCPYSCTYCCNIFLNKLYNFKNYRKRDIKRFIDEVKYMKEKYNLEYIYLSSETFLSIDEKSFSEFVELWRTEIKLPFWSETRPETITDNRIAQLKDIGLSSMSIGVESGSPVIRKMLHRYMTNEQIVNAFKILKKHSVRFCTNNIIGFPNETREQIFETININRVIGANNIMVNIFNPYRGTPLYDMCVDKGFIHSSEIGKDYRMDFILNMPHISKNEILGLQRTFAMYAKFHKSMWDKIKIAERDDIMFDNLSKIYRKKFLA